MRGKDITREKKSEPVFLISESSCWKSKAAEEIQTHVSRETFNYQWIQFSRLHTLCPTYQLWSISCFALKWLQGPAIRDSSWNQMGHCSVHSRIHILFLNDHKNKPPTEPETVFQIMNFSTLRIKLLKWLLAHNCHRLFAWRSCGAPSALKAR